MQSNQRHFSWSVTKAITSAVIGALIHDGLIAEAVTDQPFATVLSEQIWQPIGAESDALVAINVQGYSYVSGDVIARLRDIARIGQVEASGRPWQRIWPYSSPISAKGMVSSRTGSPSKSCTVSVTMRESQSIPISPKFSLAKAVLV